MRPGLSGDWRGAIEAFDTASYINRLGLTARADRLDELQTILEQHGLDVLAWYGVRVFSDTAQSNTPLPHREDLAALIEAESRAGSMDPYRAVAPLIHILACR